MAQTMKSWARVVQGCLILKHSSKAQTPAHGSRKPSWMSLLHSSSPQGIPMNTSYSKAIFGKGFVGEVLVFLAKPPRTYMNLSGELVRKQYVLFFFPLS
ncbi:hypothetical protein LR48_Vigan07g207300 [Vigna angularis]|uniref:Uncharacterized protein n=1 Tax=Phaseolus angularis TaxID=3914 RepID=A0A0L9V0T3_PHAAN|nr:hypothetical protein LR48_Vigan07g207300 [Vigna angularis]